MSPLDLVVSLLKRVRQSGPNQWASSCPAHDDQDPSLSIASGDDGRVLLHCHAGCTVEEICAALGLTGSDLFPREPSLAISTRPAPTGPRPLSPTPRRTRPAHATADDASASVTESVRRERPEYGLAHSYSYEDAAGREVMRVLRFELPGGDKTFRPLGREGDAWHIGDPKGPLPLYRLPSLGAGSRVYVVEGEKAAEAAVALGLVATTSAHGAKSASKTDWSALAGKDVVILPDNDDAGRRYAQDVAEILAKLSPPARARVVELPGLPEHGDIVEFITSRGSIGEVTSIRAEIEQLANSAKPCVGAGLLGSADSTRASQEAGPTTWPVLASNALHGLAGDFVRLVSPHSEADPIALLSQFLVEFGNCIGRGPHFVAEADRHYTNLYQVLVGRTAKGRKGTSHGHVRRLFRMVDEGWSTACEKHGLSSGEGLIWAVRDPIEKEEPIKQKGKVVGYQTVVVDPGVEDKRLLIYESEFAQCLRVLDREGNTLSAAVRNAWDTGTLSTLTKNSPAHATGAHISIIGHITQDEALRYLDRTEAANGFGNRFLWLCVRRSKVLPEGGNLSEQDLRDFALKVRMAVEFSRTVQEVRRDGEARELWAAVYHELSEGRAGLLGAITARAEAQVMRLALLYALLDMSTVIRREHLLAGLALWAYAEDSAAYVFGSSMGDPVADEILRALRATKEGLTRTQIRDLFGRNRGKDEIGRALGVLLAHRLAQPTEREREGPGPRAEVWFAGASGAWASAVNGSWRSFLSYTEAHEGARAGCLAAPATVTTRTTGTTDSAPAEAARAPTPPPTETTRTTRTTESAAVISSAGASASTGPDDQGESEWSA
jgi:hypothetical protein